MTNEEAVKMLRTMQRTVYLGNRKFEDAIECAIKALSEPLQPWEVLVAQAVLSQPKRGWWIEIINSRGVVVALRCSRCEKSPRHGVRSDFCPNCGADMREETT